MKSVNNTDQEQSTQSQRSTVHGRRELLKALGATGAAVTAATSIPGAWAKPVIEIGYLPVHAQSSPGETPPVSECVPVPTPVDVVFALDASGSIGSDIERAKQALRDFVAARDLSNDQIGIISFDTVIDTFQELTRDRATLDASIDSLASGGRTSVAVGIDAGVEELSSERTSGNPRVLVLLSDGQANELKPADISYQDDPNKMEAFEAAEAAKSAGIRMMTVAIPSSAGVDIDLMTDMASSPDDFFFVENLDQLADALSRGCE